MTRDQLFDVLRPIILTVTGVPECILENPNAQSPQGEYAAVNPQVGVNTKGQAIINRVAKPGSIQGVEVRRQIRVTAWVNFYRGDTRTRATLLMECHKRPDIGERLFRARIGWDGTGPVNDLTGLQSENFESRAQISIDLSFEVAEETDINSIESVQVIVENEQGTVLESVEIPDGSVT